MSAVDRNRTLPIRHADLAAGFESEAHRCQMSFARPLSVLARGKQYHACILPRSGPN